MSTNTKKKRGTGAAVVIIVLCLAALGALGYVIWQQFHPAVPATAAARYSMFWRMPRATPSASG